MVGILVSKKNKKKRKEPTKPVSEIGKRVPKNLRFGIIVAIALLWAQFIASGLTFYLSGFFPENQVLVDFIIAILATAVAYLIFISYKRIDNFLDKVRVPKKLQEI